MKIIIPECNVPRIKGLNDSKGTSTQGIQVGKEQTPSRYQAK